MVREPGGEGPPVLLTQLSHEVRRLDRPCDEECMDEPETMLPQVETERGDVLLGTAIGGTQPLPTVAEEGMRGMPALDTV